MQKNLRSYESSTYSLLGRNISRWSFFEYLSTYVSNYVMSFSSLAAVCIRTDKEREEAMNMQYLMPVYHQKQQAYGPYGYAAYPGPYYGSQYGPY